ncbi:MAG: HDIG domain-containing protein [Candidatus Algichlamydia australiensis]|nr:HDIG domain-containing protein [Chlamydiales bacterium]
MADEAKERKSLKFFRYLKERDRGKRFAIGFALLITLTLFLHFREVRVEMLDPGSMAQRYVVAQVDFDYADKQATNILRQQAMAEIGPIYKLFTKEINQKRLEFEESIGEGKISTKGASAQDLFNASDEVDNALTLLLFTTPATKKKMEEVGIDVSRVENLPSIQSNETVSLPPVVWQQVRIKGKNLNPRALDIVIQYYSQFGWSLKEDVAEEQSVRDLIASQVPEKRLRVKAGSSIVEQGERVTSRHVNMMQGMKEALSEKQSLLHPMTILGSFVFALIIVVLGAFYFEIYKRKFFESTRQMGLYCTIVIVTLILAKVTEYTLLHSSNHLIDLARYPLFTPFLAILLCILLDQEIALFSALFYSAIIAISLSFDSNRVLILNFIAAIVAILATRNLRRRKEVFVVCAKVWLATLPILIGFNLVFNAVWSLSTLTDLISTLVFLVATAIIVAGILPIFESIFHTTTDITLMEYTDPNNELLRRLSIEAPGTYQHCLVVGSLAEAAAQAIGANGLFCRVATLYHDIGKLNNPHYFTENQMGGFNIHQLLTPLESTQVIISHVPDGAALGRKHGLPESFIDVIEQHHGTTLVYYFYCKQIEQMGGDADSVNESQFRYPGPKPGSKETAIIMIADTVEAASRSLEDVNEEKLMEMVNRLISDKAEEGQFDECDLTFQELGKIKKALVKTLSLAFHTRIVYPKRK